MIMMGDSAYSDVLAEMAGAAGQPWALAEERAPALSGVVGNLRIGREVSSDRLKAALAVHGDRTQRNNVQLIQGQGGAMVAVVSAHGIALYRGSLPGLAFSTRALAHTMDELAADRSVGRIILNFNTPGGLVTGTPEAADAIYRAAKVKPVQAVVDPLAASAGYWLASNARQVIVNPSGQVGSIGVFVLHVSVSRALEKAGIDPTFITSKASPKKTDGNTLQPLTESARADIQGEVDGVMQDFTSAVARGRRVRISKVLSDFGRGGVVVAQDALKAGMIDGIGSLDDVIKGRSRGHISGPHARGGVPGGSASPWGTTDIEAMRRRLAIKRHD